MSRVRVAVWCAVVLVVGACAVLSQRHEPPAPGSPGRAQIEQLLGQVQVVSDRRHVAGYERGCKSDEGCVFGQAWSDDYDGRLGHDGCDTRNNVLALQLTDVAFRPGTHDCVVVAGTLADPYGGKILNFTKSAAGAVQIDHVFPLAAAWDMGASTWPLERRIRFANDIDFNLLAVSGPLNQAKSDATPADWLPPATAYRCYYAGKYLSVAVQYQLPVTTADRDTLTDIAASCG